MMISSSSSAAPSNNIVNNHNVPNHPIPRAIFLDSGGVINCNKRRSPQWIQYLTEYMPTTVLQGPGQLWGRANKQISHDLYVANGFELLMAKSKDYKDLYRLYRLHWIQTSVKLVNQYIEEEEEEANAAIESGAVASVRKKIVLPESEEEQIQIAQDAHDHCVARVRADFPGAVEAILALKQDLQYELFTCSGETSTSLKKTFQTLGIRAISDLTLEAEEEEEEEEEEVDTLHPIFTKLYGPDLINFHKASSRFYALIFEDCGIPAREALVVDDKESILAWAKALGATTVQISTQDRTGQELMVDAEQWIKNNATGVLEKKTVQVPAVDYQLHSLAELPALVAQWKNTWPDDERRKGCTQ